MLEYYDEEEDGASQDQESAYGEQSDYSSNQQEQSAPDKEDKSDKKGDENKNKKNWDKSAKRFHAHIRVDEPCPYCGEDSLYKEPLLDEIGGKAKFILMGYFSRSQRYICVNPRCRAYYAKHKSRIMRKASGKLGYSHIGGTFLDGNPFHIDR